MAACFSSSPKWKRPGNIPIGRVWHRFKGVEREGRPAPMYQIREMDPFSKDDCLQLICENYFVGNRLCEVLNINYNTVCSHSMSEYFDHFSRQNMSLACYTEEAGQPRDLVGFNFIVVKSKGDLTELELEYDADLPGECWKKLLKIRLVAEEKVKVFRRYKVPHYLTAGALTIHQDHRGQQIEDRMLHVREMICREHNIQAIASVFFSKGMQDLAAGNSYEVLGCLPYSQMREYEIYIPECGTPGALVMGKMVQFENPAFSQPDVALHM